MKPCGDGERGLQHLRDVGAQSNAYQNAPVRAQMLPDPMLQVLLELEIDHFGSEHQREFPQFREALPPLLDVGYFVRRVGDRLLGRRIHELDFIGCLYK